MRPQDLPDFLRLLQRAAGRAAVPAANAMARGFQDKVRNDVLRRTSHPPGEFWRAVRGLPPAYASGNLARSVLRQRAFRTGPASAVASVGAFAVYAGVQEFGKQNIVPVRANYMHWVNSRGPWWMKSVDIPEHPYFRPAVSEMILSGSFSRLAAEAFYREISPYFR